MIEIPGFVFYGPPRTKKNHGKIITIWKKGGKPCHACGHRPGFPKIVPGDAHETWLKSCRHQALLIKARLRQRGVDLPIAGLVSIEALIYREALSGDASGFYEAIGDMLQDVGIIVNDVQIEDWDGTRRLKDAARPRLEVYLTVLQPRAVQEELPLATVAQ